MSPAPEPVRYPFHDNDECPVGQQVKEDGQWQYYEPTQVAETRARCPRCWELDSVSPRLSSRSAQALSHE